MDSVCWSQLFQSIPHDCSASPLALLLSVAFRQQHDRHHVLAGREWYDRAPLRRVAEQVVAGKWPSHSGAGEWCQGAVDAAVAVAAVVVDAAAVVVVMRL